MKTFYRRTMILVVFALILTNINYPISVQATEISSINPKPIVTHSTVMTSSEFINYLQYVVNRGDSKYGSGDQYSIGKYDGSYIYFDCWGLGESIICTNGQIVYNKNQSLNPWNLWNTSCGCGSYSGDYLKTLCQLSTNFSSIVPGEWLFKDDSSGHCYHVGYYIGNNKVIESTTDGTYNTQISTIDSNGHSNLRSSSWTWTSHGKVPWISYSGGSYISQCTEYPSYCTVKITDSTCKIKSLPCSVNTDSSSETVEVPAVNDTYTAEKLYKNTASNYWYQVKCKNGKIGYLYADDCKYVSSIFSDVSGNNLSIPSTLSVGSFFPVSGTVTTTYNNISNVSLYIYAGTATSGKHETGDQMSVDTKTFNLERLDEKVEYNKLSSGTHNYVLRATTYGYYATGPQTATTDNSTKIIKQQTFTVGNQTKYYLDVNGLLDGDEVGNVAGYGTFDVYINGELKANDVTDYYTQWPTGTKYEIKDIKTVTGHSYIGTVQGALSGSVGSSTVSIRLSFTSGYKLTFLTNGGQFPSAGTAESINRFNEGRGAGQLVVFTEGTDGTTVGTNTYGFEVAVNKGGKVIAKRNYGDTNTLTVPAGGFVLSGHGGSTEQKGGFVNRIQIGDFVAIERSEMMAYHYTDYEEYLANHKRGNTNEGYDVLPIPKKTGYYFNGWLMDNGSYAEHNTIYSSQRLTASWATDDSAPAFKVVYGGHLYELYEYPLSWTAARSFCEAHGGHLVTITSAAEQQAVEGLLQNGRKIIYFTGCTDESSEGNWTWVTGETFSSYNNWDPQFPEPDPGDGFNYGGIVNQAIGANKQFGEWLANFNSPNDIQYSLGYRLCNYGFICEYEISCKHQYTSTVTSPTCTAQGYTTHTCSICGDSYKDSYTAALGHNYSYAATTKPTTSAAGVLTGTCSRCGGKTTVTLPKLNTTDYSYSVIKAATCTATGTGRYTWKTTIYGSYYFDVTLPKTAHNYKTTVTVPTCTAQGYTIHTCSVCGDSYKDSYTAALGHAWNSGVVTKPATETETGVRTYTCTRCGATKTEVIPKLDGDDNPFVDVPKGKYFYEPVMWAIHHNPPITGGTDATHFSPNQTCTREQVVTFLWTTYGKPEPNSIYNPFKDVKAGKYYVKPILWAVEKGITGGVEPDRFGVGESCTRAQVLTFLWVAAGRPKPSGSNNPFTDVKTTDYFYKPVMWAVEKGITGGTSATTFSPKDTCTRAQVVTFLYAALVKNNG